MTPRKLTFFVDVVGGIGETEFFGNGKLQLVCVKSPRAPGDGWDKDPSNPNCTYAYDVQDFDFFGIGGYPTMRGDQTALENKLMGDEKCKFTILNASQDGRYRVRLYLESQP